MEEVFVPKITVVTAPDFYMHGKASRILALGGVAFLQDVQHMVHKFWAAEDVVLCLSDRDQQDMGWLTFNLATTDFFLLELSEQTDAWEVATTFKFPGKVFFVCEKQDDLVVASFLNLRHDTHMFKTVLEAVVSASSSRLA